MIRHAGFWRRLAAYLVDVLPIVLLVAVVFYVYFGFDETWRAYRSQPNDPEALARFLAERNMIRNLSFLLWIVYSTIMEASPLQGTLGKFALRMRVVGRDGKRLTLARSAGRNFSKIVSYLPLCLGFLWVAFSKEKHGWHDMIAKTLVVRCDLKVQS